MKLKVIVLIVMCAFFSGVKSQENTTYFFMGHVFSINENDEEIRHPYLPVLLAYKDKPEDVVAVRLTNMVGIVSFKEIPIDIYKDYIFTLLLPKGERKFFFAKNTSAPSFKSGNYNTHIQLDGEVSKYYNKEIEKMEKGEEEMNIIPWLIKHNSWLEKDGDNLVSKESKLPVYFFVNGQRILSKSLQRLTSVLIMAAVKEVIVARYIEPNDYYEGVIDIHLTMGDYPGFGRRASSTLPEIK